MSTSINSKEFYESMRDYVGAAMSLLASECPEGASRILPGNNEWKRGSDGLFHRCDREDADWMDCIRSCESRIHALSEYGRLVDVIRSIPEINGQLETLVGTISEARRIEIPHITDHLIWRLAQLTGLGFDEPWFDQLFEQFRTDLARTSFDYYSISPLLGLTVEVAPLLLEPGVVLDRMTDDEIVRCLSNGFLASWPRSHSVANVGTPVAVRVHYPLEKRIGDREQTPIEPWLEIVTRANETAMEVLHVLRLFKEGQVSVPGLLQLSSQWPMEGGTGYLYMNPGPMPWFNKYTLSRREGETFCAFWQQTQLLMKRGTSANALRRFSYASDRDRDDDRLVDLMIAAESIFLSDTGAPQERGELRYRLALRAAFFIDAPDSTRIAVFKHMKRAYDVRSAIVHGGGEVGNDLLKSLKETPISLKEFVEVTRKLVRTAIKKRIEMAAAKGNFNIDWDALIIPSSTH